MGSASSVEKKFKKLFWDLAGFVLPANRKVPHTEIRSVLVLRPDRLGDFVLSVPAIKAVEAGLKNGKLTIVAGASNAELAVGCFPKARVWVFKKNIFSRISLWLRFWFSSFDAVIDFHSYPFSTTSTLLAVLSGSPIRIGFWATGDFKEYEEVSKRVFNHGLKAPQENLPEQQKSFLLIRQLFPKAKMYGSAIQPPSVFRKTADAVEAFYSKAGITSRHKVLGIHPTLRKEDNRWSQSRYVELIQQLDSVKGLKVVVLHGKGENNELERFQKLAQGLPNVFTLPKDDLFFILEAAKRLDGLVCNDSGIMHACAWVTNVFAVFGPSDSRRWGPRPRSGLKHFIFQTPDGLCDSVKSKQVAQVVLKQLF